MKKHLYHIYDKNGKILKEFKAYKVVRIILEKQKELQARSGIKAAWNNKATKWIISNNKLWKDLKQLAIKAQKDGIYSPNTCLFDVKRGLEKLIRKIKFPKSS